MTKDQEREQRLAEALRANLRRRKAQQRGASAPGSEGAEADLPDNVEAGTRS